MTFKGKFTLGSKTRVLKNKTRIKALYSIPAVFYCVPLFLTKNTCFAIYYEWVIRPNIYLLNYLNPNCLMLC